MPTHQRLVLIFGQVIPEYRRVEKEEWVRRGVERENPQAVGILIHESGSPSTIAVPLQMPDVSEEYFSWLRKACEVIGLDHKRSRMVVVAALHE